MSDPAHDDDRLNHAEIECFRNRVMLLVQMIVLDDSRIDKIIGAAEDFGDFACFTDPTAWIRSSGHVRDHNDVFKAYRDFREKLIEILPPEVLAKIRASSE